MANNSRQILIHLHSEDNRAPSGSILTHGEIAVSHNNLKDAALYTKIDDENVAKFISEVEVDERISAATEVLNEIIDTIEAFSGLTDSGYLVDAKVVRDVIVNDEEVTSAALNDLNDRVTYIEVSGSSTEDLERLSASVITLSAQVSTVEENVETLSGQVSTMEEGLEALSGQVVTMEEDLETLSAHVLTTEYVFATAINDLNDRVIDDEESTDSAISDLNDRLTEVAAIVSSGASKSDLEALSASVVTISAKTEILNDIIDTVGEFSGLTENGYLVDAKVVKDVIAGNVEALDDRITDNEEVTSAALNDLNDRIIDLYDVDCGTYS